MAVFLAFHFPCVLMRYFLVPWPSEERASRFFSYAPSLDSKQSRPTMYSARGKRSVHASRVSVEGREPRPFSCYCYCYFHYCYTSTSHPHLWLIWLTIRLPEFLRGVSKEDECEPLFKQYKQCLSVRPSHPPPCPALLGHHRLCCLPPLLLHITLVANGTPSIGRFSPMPPAHGPYEPFATIPYPYPTLFLALALSSTPLEVMSGLCIPS